MSEIKAGARTAATGAIAVGDEVEVGQTLQFHVRDADSAGKAACAPSRPRSPCSRERLAESLS